MLGVLLALVTQCCTTSHDVAADDPHRIIRSSQDRSEPASITEARRFIGTHDGAQFNRELGLPDKSPWCLAFVQHCFRTATPATSLPRTGRCSQLWRHALARPVKFEVIETKRAGWKRRIRPGDIVIFAHNPESADFNGHAEQLVDVPADGIDTIGGNTRPTDQGDQRQGNTVALKHRRAGVHAFWLLGFVRERRP